jgi:hypothetical protein
MPAEPREPEPIRAQSRAEPPPERRRALAIGLVTVVLVSVALVVKLLASRPAHVPLGIAGFRLGADVEAAQKVLPSLAPAPPLPAVMNQVAGFEVKYPRLAGKSLLFDEPAKCTLEFAVEGTLSRIDCEVDPLPSAELQENAARRVLKTLRALYGGESSSRPNFWEWRNAEARLSLYVSDAKEPSAVIRLSNVGARHDRAVGELVEAERRRVLDDAKRVLEERKKEVERIREELDAGAGP